ncbi:hypothetical protein MMC22_000921 [Lobaria immixta]|nr:hypothetical protein [Lobaria immixta]
MDANVAGIQKLEDEVARAEEQVGLTMDSKRRATIKKNYSKNGADERLVKARKKLDDAKKELATGAAKKGMGETTAALPSAKPESAKPEAQCLATENHAAENEAAGQGAVLRKGLMQSNKRTSEGDEPDFARPAKRQKQVIGGGISLVQCSCSAQKPKAGFRPYPYQFGRNKGVAGDDVIFALLDAFPICKTGQGGMKYFEFPLSIPVFAGSNTSAWSPDRAIATFSHAGTGEATFVLTHRQVNSAGEESMELTEDKAVNDMNGQANTESRD